MSAFGAYNLAGFVLTPIPLGSKGPVIDDWNKPENLITDGNLIPDETFNAGLCHLQSGTCAIDLDDLELAKFYFQMKGVDLQAYLDDPNMVKIESGSGNHAKLIFRVDKPLLTKRYSRNNLSVFELRCATAKGTTVQDVIPPSLHPIGTRYKWIGNWMNIPQLPEDIKQLWLDMINVEPPVKKLTSSVPDATWHEVESALAAVDPSCSYQVWCECMMAVWRYGFEVADVDKAIDLIDNWSSKSYKYPGRQHIRNKCKSFSNHHNPIEVGSLFFHAIAAGWVRPKPDVSHIFQNVEMLPPDTSGLTPFPPPTPPLECVPAVLRKRAEEVSVSVGCDPLVPLFAGLGAACAAADGRSRLELMPGYVLPPILWLMIIGPPADKKSPGSRPMFSILQDIEREDVPRYQQALQQFEAQDIMFGAAKKAWTEHFKTGDAALGAAAPPLMPEPKPPVAKRLKVSDITSQSLVRIVADRPEGVLCHLDEMAGWANKLSKPTSSEDRSAWTVGFEADTYALDRVGTGHTKAENYAVAIYGNIQPTPLRAANELLASDGLLQRFILGPIRPALSKKGSPIPAYMDSSEEYERAIRHIHAVGQMRYVLSSDAYRAFDEFQDFYQTKKRAGEVLRKSNHYMTALGKYEGIAGRLIFIFHLLTDPANPIVSVEVTESALDFMTRYIMPSLDYCCHEILGDREDSISKWIALHVLQNCHEEQLTLSQIKRSARRQVEGLTEYQVIAIIREEMGELQRIGWVRLTEDKGRNITWAINPDLHATFGHLREEYTRVRTESTKADSIKNWRARDKYHLAN